MNKDIKAVLFDLDGTLTDSLKDIAEAANNALRIRGHRTFETEEYKYFLGRGLYNLMKAICPAECATEEELKALYDLHAEYYSIHGTDSTKPFDGMLALLTELKNRGLKLAVVSNKHQPGTLEVVSSLFQDGTFDYITGLQDGFTPKPAPDLALHAAKQLGFSPEECAFVGDTEMDLQCGESAGMYVIACSWGFRTVAELKKLGAQRIAEHPSDILKFL